jgi:hypothetical protein
MKNLGLAMVLGVLALPVPAAGQNADIEATTASGEKVLLHPSGRWEFVAAQKQAEARKVADQFPENKGCPPGWQGGLFGIGRCIPPGDKDYNRGSRRP